MRYESEFAEIRVESDAIAPGKNNLRYRWVGDVNKPVWFGHYLELDDNLPWPMKKIQDDANGRIYIRTDVRFRWVTELKYWMARTHSHFKNRIIFTFRIWGIGYTEPGNIPQWRDIFRKRPNANL